MTEELTIFAEIKFRESKCFAAPNFREFAKKSQNRETLFRKCFLLQSILGWAYGHLQKLHN